MKILPTKGNVFCIRTGHEEKTTASGIIIANTLGSAQERVLIQGRVEAIGEEITQVKIGDMVLFARYEGWPITATKSKDDTEFIVSEKHILAIIT